MRWQYLITSKSPYAYSTCLMSKPFLHLATRRLLRAGAKAAPAG